MQNFLSDGLYNCIFRKSNLHGTVCYQAVRGQGDGSLRMKSFVASFQTVFFWFFHNCVSLEIIKKYFFHLSINEDNNNAEYTGTVQLSQNFLIQNFITTNFENHLAFF